MEWEGFLWRADPGDKSRASGCRNWALSHRTKTIIKSIHGDNGTTRYWRLLSLNLRTVLCPLLRSCLVNSAHEKVFVGPVLMLHARMWIQPPLYDTQYYHVLVSRPQKESESEHCSRYIHTYICNKQFMFMLENPSNLLFKPPAGPGS